MRVYVIYRGERLSEQYWTGGFNDNCSHPSLSTDVSKACTFATAREAYEFAARGAERCRRLFGFKVGSRLSRMRGPMRPAIAA